MKFYELNTLFTFGKFENSTLRDVVEIQPSYIDWCVINLKHFYIDEDVIDSLKVINSSFLLSNESMNILSEKYEDWHNSKYSSTHNEYDDESHTYDNYNGSYAQDYEGWSDQDINDVFEGDPNAYWNID